jgi:hypothetical protein
MTQLTFRVKGAKITRKGLENLGAEIPKISRSRIRKVLDRVVKEMKVYPPAPSGSIYERTFKLRRGWKVQRLGETGYRIENRARFRGRAYVKYVVGSATGEKQAWMHKGRWKLFRGVVDAEGAKLPREVAKHIMLKARKLRLA